MERPSAKHGFRNRQGGFTIAEVMLVIIMIGLLASLGGGVWVGTYNSMLVKKAARDFVLTAKYARVMAIERQQPYKMTLDIESGGFFVSTSGWSEEAEEAEQTVVQDYYSRPVAFEGKVVFEEVKIVPVGEEADEQEVDGAESQSIVFRPDGSAQQAVIQIGDGDTHYSVGISPATGRAKLYDGTIEKVKITSVDLDEEE